MTFSQRIQNGVTLYANTLRASFANFGWGLLVFASFGIVATALQLISGLPVGVGKQIGELSAAQVFQYSVGYYLPIACISIYILLVVSRIVINSLAGKSQSWQKMTSLSGGTVSQLLLAVGSNLVISILMLSYGFAISIPVSLVWSIVMLLYVPTVADNAPSIGTALVRSTQMFFHSWIEILTTYSLLIISIFAGFVPVILIASLQQMIPLPGFVSLILAGVALIFLLLACITVLIGMVLALPVLYVYASRGRVVPFAN